MRADDPNGPSVISGWASVVPFTLPDNDVAEIDVATRMVTRYFSAVGTTNTGIAVHPTTGELWVANTDARNLVRFEPNVKGHCIDSRLTRITTGVTPTITPFDLNPGVNYTQFPNPAALGTALAEPFDVAIDAAGGIVYVAAHGTDRVGVLDLNGNVLARIEVGNSPGAVVDTHNKRGPRGLALHPSASRLYVLNRLSDTLSVIDTGTRTVLREQPIATWDPMPTAIRTGRKFLYDSKLSGNGTMSCAACHIDADNDGLAWDLGDPNGSLQPAPTGQPSPFNLFLTQFHPMKGPMTTQTLRGLDNIQPLHWRGDRATFQDFNPAFASLMGGSPLSTADMNLYAGFATSIAMPPNPNQQLDRSRPNTPANNNEATGLAAFQAIVANIQGFQVGCVTCHALPRGTNRMVVGAPLLMSAQEMKVPQLRSLYRKVGFNRAPGPQKTGFGFINDGSIDTLTSFLNLQQFNQWPSATKDDIATFLMAFDTGTAPLCGYQLTVTQGNAGNASVTSDLALFTSRVAAGDIDLIAKGLLDGRHAGLLYQPATATWITDRASDAPLTQAQPIAKAQQGNATLTFMGVPPGSGTRLGIDRDLDGTLDGDEGILAYGNGSAGCSGVPLLDGNSEPRVGNASFAIVGNRAQPSAPGFLLMGNGQGSTVLAGITVLVLEPA
jgi:YVTN family beta-propeller protein